MGPKAVVHSWSDFTNLSLDTQRILVEPNSCNDGRELDFSRFHSLLYLEIGDDSFKKVSTFAINGLNNLTLLIIGENSFSEETNEVEYSFSIVDCPSLVSIEIWPESFVNYGGVFQLTNLPSLERLKIGKLGERSDCFSASNFKICG